MRQSPCRVIAYFLPVVALGGLLLALFWKGTALDLSWVGLGSKVGLDITGRSFLLFTSILWLLSSVYGIGYLKDDQRRCSYDWFFLATMLGNFGLILAQDAVTFYACFALMSFASFGLVVHNRDAAAVRASRVYIILVIIGEVALFAGLVCVLAGSGINQTFPIETNVAPSQITVALLVFGFGIKAGVVLLHVWLPLAHPAAPPPASAVLSGAMIKAGLLGWIRFLPLGHTGFEGWGTALMIAGLVSAFYGVAIGLLQTNPKAILAYSSISQMGFMTFGVGAGLLEPNLWPAMLIAVTVYAFHHALAKGALFLGTGIALGGLSRLAWIGILLPALSLVGTPFLSGAAAKSALKSAVPNLSGSWPTLLAVLLPLAAIGTSILLIRFMVVLRTYHLTSHGKKDRRWMFLGWGLLVVCSSMVVWFWEPASGFAFGSIKGAKLITATWPVILAGGLAWTVLNSPLKLPRALIGSIPAGDILVFPEWVISKFSKVDEHLWSPTFSIQTVGIFLKKILRYIAKTDKELGRWSIATVLLFTLLSAMLTLSLLYE